MPNHTLRKDGDHPHGIILSSTEKTFISKILKRKLRPDVFPPSLLIFLPVRDS